MENLICSNSAIRGLFSVIEGSNLKPKIIHDQLASYLQVLEVHLAS